MRQLCPSLLRPLSLALVLIVLLAQAYLLYHETEHAALGEDESCLVCQLAQHQDHGPVSHVPSVVSGDFSSLHNVVAQILISISERYFASRAPPVAIPL